VRWWRPLSPDTWQAPSAPDISYMVGPSLPSHTVHICQSGPACSFYYRPGPATERLVYQGRIKGILRPGGGGNRPAMWRPPPAEVAKLHCAVVVACLHILSVDKRVCSASNKSSRNRNAEGFPDTYISNQSRHICCAPWRKEGSGVSGVCQTATNIRFRCRQNVLPFVMPKCFDGAGSRAKFLNARATSTNNLFGPE